MCSPFHRSDLGIVSRPLRKHDEDCFFYEGNLARFHSYRIINTCVEICRCTPDELETEDVINHDIEPELFKCKEIGCCQHFSSLKMVRMKIVSRARQSRA